MTPPKSDPRTTMLVITTGFLGLHLLFDRSWLLTVAFVAGLIGVFSPWLSGKVEWVWHRLAMALGWINGHVLLSLVFFAVLTPIALLRRLGKRDALGIHDSSNAGWAVRDHAYGPADLEKPW